ncbi:MAG: CPBP family intramembrane metalloprotease [Candidatus Cloacimonetes bacterium]|nr:CPBP family intramembrane metalloprotease [Candidatus Cloacimonadota bacterium]
MNFKKVGKIFRKEILEVFRDKRTMFTVILLPMILYPIIFIGVSTVMMRQTVKIQKQGADINLVYNVQPENQESINLLIQAIQEDGTLRVSTMPADYVFPEDAKPDITITVRDSLTASNTWVFLTDVLYDNTQDSSEMAQNKVSKIVGEVEKKVTTQRLAKIGVGDEYLNLFRYKAISIASDTQNYGKLLGTYLPYLLMMLIVTGGAVVATDLIAGEKERKTLETLLISAAKRNEIVLGKYLTIITMSGINVVVNLFSISVSMKYMLSSAGMNGSNMNIPIMSFVYILFALLPLITLFSALLLSISTFARNIKEAKSYESPLMMLAMFGGMVSMFPGIELNAGLAMIPVVNVSLLMKEILMGNFILPHFLMTVGSILVLDVIAILVTVKLFNSESILFRTEEETNLKSIKKDSKNFFNPFFGIIYFTLALLAFYYIGFAMQQKDLVDGLLKTQILIILLPPFLIVRFLKMPLKVVFRQNNTKPINFALVILGAIPLAIAASSLSQVINFFYPIPAEYLEKLTGIIKMDEFSLGKALMIIAVLPGFCEEMMFRGFMYRFFENGKKWFPIVASAMLFAIYHLDMFRLLPAFLLGLYLGFLLQRTNSIYITILAHSLNNGIAVLLSRFQEVPWMQVFISDNGEINLIFILISFVLVGIVIWLIKNLNPLPKVLDTGIH